MTLLRASAIIAAMLAKKISTRTVLQKDHDPAWRLACFIDNGWVRPDALSEHAESAIRSLESALSIGPGSIASG